MRPQTRSPPPTLTEEDACEASVESRRLHEPLMRSVSAFGFNDRPRRLLHQRPKLPISPRQRAISLNCNLVNTEREPILRDEKSNKTIFVQGKAFHSMPYISCNSFNFYVGRPPWFCKDGGVLKEPFFIGISGGSASGKTTVAANIIKQLDVQWVTLL